MTQGYLTYETVRPIYISKCFLWVACSLSNSFQIGSPGFISRHRVFLHSEFLSEDCINTTVTVLSPYLSDGSMEDWLTVYRPTRAKMPKSKGQLSGCLHTPAWAMGSFTKDAPLLYWQQWTESSRQACWVTNWRSVHSLICWPHCRAHELLAFSLDNWDEIMHFLNNYAFILIHLAIWCCIIAWHGRSIIFMFFFGGCSH